MNKKMTKRLLLALAVIIGLIGAWYYYQASTAVPSLKLGGGMWDEETRQFIDPNNID